MQPGNPGQDPYGQQNPNDPTASPDPYRQPPPQPYGQPGAGEPPQTQPGADQPPAAQPSPGQPRYGPAPGYPEPGHGGAGPAGGPGAPNNTLGLLALVFGIVAVPLGLCCGLFGAPFGIAALVLGFLGRNKADQGQATNRSQAMTGLILGAVGIVLAIISVIIGQLIDWREFTNTN
ncbi:MAG TPA: DUF4190 domain-containing protein [Micromonosporaceae bacterium]|nr:DUF4190 domain-containing protein [Micromonosporaceae bacterium]